jgi:hypothetical protein
MARGEFLELTMVLLVLELMLLFPGSMRSSASPPVDSGICSRLPATLYRGAGEGAMATVDSMQKARARAQAAERDQQSTLRAAAAAEERAERARQALKKARKESKKARKAARQARKEADAAGKAYNKATTRVTRMEAGAARSDKAQAKRAAAKAGTKRAVAKASKPAAAKRAAPRKVAAKRAGSALPPPEPEADFSIPDIEPVDDESDSFVVGKSDFS